MSRMLRTAGIAPASNPETLSNERPVQAPEGHGFNALQCNLGVPVFLVVSSTRICRLHLCSVSLLSEQQGSTYSTHICAIEAVRRP